MPNLFSFQPAEHMSLQTMQIQRSSLLTLRKQAYTNTLLILPPKERKYQDEKL